MNYSKILSKSQINDIRNHYRAVKRETERLGGLDAAIEGKLGSLRETIQAEVDATAGMVMGDIRRMIESDVLITGVCQKISDCTHGNLLVTEKPDFKRLVKDLHAILDEVNETREGFPIAVETLELIGGVDYSNIDLLTQLLTDHQAMRSAVFGYFLKKKRIEKWDSDFKEAFPRSSLDVPHLSFDRLLGLLELLSSIKEPNIDSLRQFSRVNYRDLICELLISDEELDTLTKLAGTIGTYSELQKKAEKAFIDVPPSGYYRDEKSAIEDLVTTQVTFMLDSKVIDFYDNHKNDAVTLREIIRKKKKFPKEEFERMKNAFPCILAGIRDYAEYIPLEPGIFDVLIIDEASQVSIAQAFPAILRAKKVVVFGDKKQFSNVKSYHASNEVNQERVNRLEDAYRNLVSDKQTQLERFEKFNIRTSILEFFEFISNFDMQLLKHFRGYKELISYSNRYFYRDKLQVMKIRGKPIEDVLRISVIDHDGKVETTPNTNSLEAEFIVSELEKLYESNAGCSVGIITPHTNQQKHLMEIINRHRDADSFFKDMRLKIMTFDTCQGDEKDIVFYSMVATRTDDRLRHIFVNDIRAVDLETEKKIMAQRLNVGFSRSKESVHFVLSKTPDEYSGGVGEAIRHYVTTRDNASREKDVSEVDPRSPRERLVLNWFYQTEFWKTNKDYCEIEPQFEIGKYLKQLDPNYVYPEYRVDFLLLYRDSSARDHKIVLEYDGFEDHFASVPDQETNEYLEYLIPEDVYRQKILEGYGYKFLRLNKFVLRGNPIASLDQLLEGIIAGRKKERNPLKEEILKDVEGTVLGLENGDMKECSKCGQVKDLTEFYDVRLSNKYGRICNQCKSASQTRKKDAKLAAGTPTKTAGSISCPICGSSMTVRSGPYGAFYGCTRYPRCRGTRIIAGPSRPRATKHYYKKRR